jgi:hypothetical protein
MPGRHKKQKTAAPPRFMLEAMAQGLELDPMQSMYEPPLTLPERTLGAYRVAQTLLFTCTTPDAWPDPNRAAALQSGRMEARLRTGECNSAIAWTAAGLGRVIGDAWAEDAHPDPSDPEGYGDPALFERMSDFANASNELADSAEWGWRIEDPSESSTLSIGALPPGRACSRAPTTGAT